MYNPQASVAAAVSAHTVSRDSAPEALSVALKRGTRDAHRRAETTGVIRQLVRRQASSAGYIRLLRTLHPVYRALERRIGALEHDPDCAFVADPSLYRSQSIEQDLGELAGTAWRSTIPLLPAARAYAERIDKADESQVLAHAYVRYLGDLNGGQIIKRLLRESLALEAAELTYYEFDGIADAASYSAYFKRSLDALPTTHDPNHIVAEALAAFRLATDLSIAVEDSLSKS